MVQISQKCWKLHIGLCWLRKMYFFFFLCVFIFILPWVCMKTWVYNSWSAYQLQHVHLLRPYVGWYLKYAGWVWKCSRFFILPSTCRTDTGMTSIVSSSPPYLIITLGGAVAKIEPTSLVCICFHVNIWRIRNKSHVTKKIMQHLVSNDVGCF